MARPEKTTVEYFPFYCDEGKKMFYIEENYGNDGFATFIKILRELAKSDLHYLNLSKTTTIMFLSAKCKVSKNKLESIIQDLVDLEKFDKLLWEENKIIWCQDFVDSIQDAYIKRKNKCITYQGLLTHLLDLGIRKPSKCTLSGDGNTQRKEKEIKEDKIKEDNTISIYPDFEDFWNEYDKKVGKIEIIENKWKKLKQAEKEKIMAYIPKYKLSQPEKKFRKNPETFLNNESWNDELISEVKYQQVNGKTNNTNNGTSQEFRDKTAKRLGIIQS